MTATNVKDASSAARLGTRWTEFWFAPTPAARLAIFRILVSWLLLYDLCIYDARPFVAMAAGGHATSWRPIYAFELFGIGPASVATTELLHWVQWGAIVAMGLGVCSRSACLVAALLAFWSGGMIYSLTKVHHDRVVLFFASFALAFAPCGLVGSLDARWRQIRDGRRDQQTTVDAWPLRLTQVTLAIGYAAAGFAKLLTPGWTNGYSLQGILIGHSGTGPWWVHADLLLHQAFSWLTIVVEAGFPLLLFWPRLAWLLLPTILGFHMGTWATMDTGPYMTLWFFLVAFVPFDRIPAWWASHGRWGRGVVIVALGGSIALLAVIFTKFVPAKLLAVQALATAIAVGAGCWRPPAARI